LVSSDLNEAYVDVVDEKISVELKKSNEISKVTCRAESFVKIPRVKKRVISLFKEKKQKN
jgi:hypothetical protein